MKKRTKYTKALALLLAVLMILNGLTACGPASDVNSTEDAQASTQEPASTGQEDATQDALPEGQWAQKLNSREITSHSSIMLSDYFDEKFMEYISTHTEGNYMVSPLSFRYALGLLLAGADGRTKRELLDALGVQSEEEWIEYCLIFNGFVEKFAADLDADVSEFQKARQEGLISEDEAEPFRALRVANSVWKAERIKREFKNKYKESVERNYGAEYRSFTTENAVEKINEWADIKTEHMIPELLPEYYPTDDLAIVLMNALYFKDSLVNSFPKSETKEGDFHSWDERTTRKDFMSAEMEALYFADDATELIILPMEGGVYMAIVLGATARFAEKISKAKYKNVKVTIPKIDLETDLSNGELVDFLKQNGVNQAFNAQKADFAAMITHQVYVSDIIQKTRIKLDEDGVEAAAVTAILLENGAEPEPAETKVFTADHPFSFFIYTTCNDTTAILFAGEIVE